MIGSVTLHEVSIYDGRDPSHKDDTAMIPGFTTCRQAVPPVRSGWPVHQAGTICFSTSHFPDNRDSILHTQTMVKQVITGWMQRPFVALGLLAFGMGMIPLNDALIKLMSAYMPLAEIALIRGILSMMVLAIFTGGVRSMLALPARVFWSFFGRGMCLVLAMILYFVPLGSLPLPTVITIFFVSPLLITILSVPLLGERIGIHRILSVVMGLFGVLTIIRPGTEEFQIESVVVFGAALSYAAFQIWTRRLKSVGNGDGAAGLLYRRVPAGPADQLFPAAGTIGKCDIRFSVPCAGHAGDTGLAVPCCLYTGCSVPVDGVLECLSLGRGVADRSVRIYRYSLCRGVGHSDLGRLA